MSEGILSRLVNSFRRNDGDEQRAFQVKVLSLLREMRPDRTFSATDDPLTLKCDESTLGLTNLRANFLLTTRTDSDLRLLLQESLVVTIDAVRDLGDTPEWDTAKRYLMPQLMPSEYLNKMDLVSKPFGDTVVIGYVLDSDKTYSYVTVRDFESWGIGLESLHTQALNNLDLRSKGLEATVVEGTNGIIAIDTLDGFDASRILLPDLRERFAETLGTCDFFFGIPNRDFLICWSASDDETFQSQLRGQIASDTESRPYPLSGKTFIARSDGSIEVYESNATADERAEKAHNN
ncbi:MAG: DUF1444 family protein [Pyrinomonadaceae bacterium]